MAIFLTSPDGPQSGNGDVQQGNQSLRRHTDDLSAQTDRLNPFQLEKFALFSPQPEAKAILEAGRIEIPELARLDPIYFRTYTTALMKSFQEAKIPIQDALRASNIYDDDLVSSMARSEATRRAVDALRAKVQLTTDSLTGLPNREYLEEALPFWLERAMQEGYPLTYGEFDMDNFKLANTFEGHEGGDRVLRRAGMIGKSPLRELEIIGRKQGDEYFIILPGVSLGGSASRGQMIVERSKAFLIEELHSKELPQDATITFSGGASTFDPAFGLGLGRVPGEDADKGIERILNTHGGVKRFSLQMQENADIALSHAKSKPGKNRFEVYTPGMTRVTNLSSAGR